MEVTMWMRESQGIREKGREGEREKKRHAHARIHTHTHTHTHMHTHTHRGHNVDERGVDEEEFERDCELAARRCNIKLYNRLITK